MKTKHTEREWDVALFTHHIDPYGMPKEMYAALEAAGIEPDTLGAALGADRIWQCFDGYWHVDGVEVGRHWNEGNF